MSRKSNDWHWFNQCFLKTLCHTESNDIFVVKYVFITLQIILRVLSVNVNRTVLLSDNNKQIRSLFSSHLTLFSQLVCVYIVLHWQYRTKTRRTWKTCREFNAMLELQGATEPTVQQEITKPVSSRIDKEYTCDTPAFFTVDFSVAFVWGDRPSGIHLKSKLFPACLELNEH